MKRATVWVIFLLLAGAGWLGWQRLHAPPPGVEAPVDLAKHDGKTIDFSSGRPVVKDSPADKAAIDAALKDMAAATRDVTFEAPKRKPEPPPSMPGK